jgi:hypothetical protein
MFGRSKRINPVAIELEENEILMNILLWQEFHNNSPRLFVYEAIDIDIFETINAGQSKELINKTEVGKLDAVILNCTSNKLKVILEIDDKKIIGTADQLRQAGLFGYNPTTFYLTVYDDESTPNRFVMMMTPNPKREYYGHFKITLKNEDSVPVSYTYSIYRYRLKDELMDFFRRG